MEREALRKELEKVLDNSFFPATKKEIIDYIITGEPISFEAYTYLERMPSDRWHKYPNLESVLPEPPVQYPYYLITGSDNTEGYKVINPTDFFKVSKTGINKYVDMKDTTLMLKRYRQEYGVSKVEFDNHYINCKLNWELELSL